MNLPAWHRLEMTQWKEQGFGELYAATRYDENRLRDLKDKLETLLPLTGKALVYYAPYAIVENLGSRITEDDVKLRDELRCAASNSWLTDSERLARQLKLVYPWKEQRVADLRGWIGVLETVVAHDQQALQELREFRIFRTTGKKVAA